MKRILFLSLPLFLLLVAACGPRIPDMSDNVQVRIQFPGSYYIDITSGIMDTAVVLKGDKTVNIGYPKFFFLFVARKDLRDTPMTVTVIDNQEKKTVYKAVVEQSDEDIHFYGSKSSGQWKFSK